MDVYIAEQQHREHMIGLVFKLALGCPGKLQHDCPLNECRQLCSLRDQYEQIKAMETDDLEMVYLYHQHCLQKQQHTN